MNTFGKAELMLALVQIFLSDVNLEIPAAQRKEIEQECETEILANYPTVRELEVTA